MAKKTKHFIELGDMKAVVLECKQCASSTSFPFSAPTTVIPTSCPNCNAPWDHSASPQGFNAIVGQFITRHQGLTRAFGGEVSRGVGYTISIQIDLGLPEVFDSINQSAG
jgi:hypothetical protein